MAFIPLDSTQKLQGKAAIDGVGSRLGKGASSLIYQFLLIVLPSISACVPFVALIVITGLLVCLVSIHYLSQERENRLKTAES